MTDQDLQELTERLRNFHHAPKLDAARAMIMPNPERTDRACHDAFEMVEDLKVALLAARTRAEVVQVTRVLEQVGTKIDMLASVARTIDERWEDFQ